MYRISRSLITILCMTCLFCTCSPCQRVKQRPGPSDQAQQVMPWMRIEAKTHVLPALKAGIFDSIMDALKGKDKKKSGASEAEIRQAYRDVLKRNVDPGGLTEYMKRAKNDGWTKAQIVADLKKSEEYQKLLAKQKSGSKTPGAETAKPETPPGQGPTNTAQNSTVPASAGQVAPSGGGNPEKVTGETIRDFLSNVDMGSVSTSLGKSEKGSSAGGGLHEVLAMNLGVEDVMGSIIGGGPDVDEQAFHGGSGEGGADDGAAEGKGKGFIKGEKGGDEKGQGFSWPDKKWMGGRLISMVSKKYRPDCDSLSIDHPGVPDGGMVRHTRGMNFSNLPPFRTIHAMRLSGRGAPSGKAEFVSVGIRAEGVKLGPDETWVAMKEDFNTSEMYPGGVFSLRIPGGSLPRDGGNTLRLDIDAGIRSPSRVKIDFSGLELEVLERPPNSVCFPARVVTSPVIPRDGAARVGFGGSKELFVAAGSEISLHLLWDGNPVVTKTFKFDGDQETLENEIAAMEVFSKDFVDDGAEPGEHTLGLRVEYEKTDPEGNPEGQTELDLIDPPRTVMVLDIASVSDYVSLVYVITYGSDNVPEDVDCAWSFSWHATFWKEDPDPALITTEEQAELFAGVVPDSLKYRIDWGDGTPPGGPDTLDTDPGTLWQESVRLSHRYLDPGTYDLKISIDFDKRGYVAVPSIGSLQSWKRVDKAGATVTSIKRITVQDTTPPVLNDRGYQIDCSPRIAQDPSDASDTGSVMKLRFEVDDNTSTQRLEFITLNTCFGGTWRSDTCLGDSLPVSMSDDGSMKRFTVDFLFRVPLDFATKGDRTRGFPLYVSAGDDYGNLNDGDLAIRNNNTPPVYGAAGRGPLGGIVVYDSIPPEVKLSFLNPDDSKTYEYLIKSIRDGVGRLLVYTQFVSDGSQGRIPILDRNEPDKNRYPFMTDSELLQPATFPAPVKLREDRRISLDISCHDNCDGSEVALEILNDGQKVHGVDGGSHKLAVIFREAGSKVLTILARDKKNADGSYNLLRAEIPFVIGETKMTVETLGRK